MKWYTLFRQHILDRGIEYYEDGHVIEYHYSENEITAQVDGTEIYDVHIVLDEEDVIDMECSCPYARDGRNCKHMAAVLFAFEGMLAKQDEEGDLDILPPLSFDEKYQKEKQEVIELISQIPEEKVRELLAGFVLADESLKNKLQIEYSFKMNRKLMLDLRKELNEIEYKYSRGGYVDWYHASEFASELEYFLDTKVMLLIEKQYLKQAFELTNLVFYCIGNIDMDDSDGNSTYVANRCFECWKLIIEKSDEEFKNQMKKWFEMHRTGYVIDFLDEYIEEILMEAFPTKEMLIEEIQKLDFYISKCQGNDCGRYYTVHHGFVNPVLKRIEYMKKMGCTDTEIIEYRNANRRFSVIRELEISEAIEKGNYETAIKGLIESKMLDEGNQEQIKKYCEQLINLYKITGAIQAHCNELISYLENFWQYDLTYVKMLKSSIADEKQWNCIVDDIVKKNRHEDFVCKLLHEEQRYEQLMNRIEMSSDKVGLLDVYEKVLRKKMPERVIKIYSEYLKNVAEMANERKKYQYLMSYLKKISKCAGGDVIAKDIADSWKRVYKRRTAMMDELRKAGF